MHRLDQDAEFIALTARVRAEIARTGASTGEYQRLLHWVREDDEASRDLLAKTLVQLHLPLWEREIAAFALGSAGDRRAFETLVFLLNYRDPARGATAAEALLRLRDPRTAKAAVALATNELRTAYATHPLRLLVALRAPESVPTLVRVLRRLVSGPHPHHRVALTCVEGLAELGDRQALPVLEEAGRLERLADAAAEARARIQSRSSSRPAPGSLTPPTSNSA